MFKPKTSTSFWYTLKGFPQKVSQSFNGKIEKFEKRVEGTMAENWLKYWKNVCRDYRDVAVDVVKDANEKPSKAILIGSTFGLLTYFAKHNPNAAHFRDTYVRNANEVSLVHHSLVREETKKHLQLIEKSYNSDVIRHTSFGVFSFIWIDDYSSRCAQFKKQCSYLELGYWDILGRIVDVGFLDTWWIFAKNMTDYDINY